MGRVKRQAKTDQLSEDEKENRRWWYLLAMLVALISVLIALIWSVTLYRSGRADIVRINPSSSSSASSKPYRISGEVQTKTLFSPGNAFARECARGGEPVVIRNSVVTKWQAYRWSPAYIQSRTKLLSGVYENDNRWFGPYFDHRKPLSEYTKRFNPYKTNVTLSLDEFFKRLHKPLKNHFYYFTGDLDQLGQWAYQEIQPINELLLLNPKRSSVNVWMGQPNVIAHCHYDGYHNFYAQLYGTKRFILFSPTNWPGLYPYPFLHPSHAQAQVNATDSDDVRRFKLIRNVEALKITLRPGDLLYIPPLWFHEVESLSVSISVNVWTDSQQTELVERIFMLPLPLDYNYESSHRHKHIKWKEDREQNIGVTVLVFRLLEQICRYHNCVDPTTSRFYDLETEHPMNQIVFFVHQLWSVRYKYMMERKELPNLYLNGSNILCEGGDSQDIQIVHAVDESMSADIHYGAYLEQVSQLTRGLPEETWQLWVGNYLEYIVANAVKDVKYVGLFLKHFSSCTKHLK